MDRGKWAFMIFTHIWQRMKLKIIIFYAYGLGLYGQGRLLGKQLKVSYQV